MFSTHLILKFKSLSFALLLHLLTFQNKAPPVGFSGNPDLGISWETFWEYIVPRHNGYSELLALVSAVEIPICSTLFNSRFLAAEPH